VLARRGGKPYARRMSAPASLPVTLDKSHLITIGERLYAQSIDLIRELVNNAYDADATRVRITLTSDAITIEDNGSGMDLEGLKQYFNIGSAEKLLHPLSPRYQRPRIGQFGIGKFASLSACRRFEVFTQREGFAARVVFDKEAWAVSGDVWEVPLELLQPDPSRGDGTTLRLLQLTKAFSETDVERRLIEGVPLRAPHFEVYLNARKVMPRAHTGIRIPVLDGTPFGLVSGEIIILPASSASFQDTGIEVRVKGATICRELFGMESWGKVVARVRGEINADFLPVTSSRNGFIRDSEAYQSFAEVMSRVMAEVRRQLEVVLGEKENRRAGRALNEALRRIQRALAANPELSPLGLLPVGQEDTRGGEAARVKKETKPQIAVVAEGAEIAPATPEPEADQAKSPDVPAKRRPAVQRLTTNALVRRMKFGSFGISCCLDHFGEDAEEVFSEGSVIYINRDHPLYRREMKNPKTYVLHVARLLTQEIALMKDPENPRQAFARQSRLLKDAFSRD